MALINCSECKKEISSEAIACPQCGHPVKKEESVVNEYPIQSVIQQQSQLPISVPSSINKWKKIKKISAIAGTLGFIAIFMIGSKSQIISSFGIVGFCTFILAAIGYLIAQFKIWFQGKLGLVVLIGIILLGIVAGYPILRHIVSTWEDRAINALKDMPPATRELLAEEVIARTHPTGKYRKLVSYQTYQTNEIIIFEMQINWTGGISEKIYSSLFQWTFNKHGHIEAKIIKEDSLFKVDAEDQNMLNEVFAIKYFPLFNDIAEGKKMWK